MIFTLVGMPSCGKTCMGKAVSAKLGLKLIDSDRLIEQKFGKRLQSILDELGVDEFRKEEEGVLLNISPQQNEHIILSTGGSAIYSQRGIDHLRQQGKIIYLYCSLPTVISRIKNPSDRGIVLKPGQTMADLYDERIPLYEAAADITISCDGKSYPKYQREISEIIIKYIRSASH